MAADKAKVIGIRAQHGPMDSKSLQHELKFLVQCYKENQHRRPVFNPYNPAV